MPEEEEEEEEEAGQKENEVEDSGAEQQVVEQCRDAGAILLAWARQTFGCLLQIPLLLRQLHAAPLMSQFSHCQS
jgi:hypothetical protein